jgi:hypothetical protein
MISLPKIPYIHRIFMVQANPKNLALPSTSQRLLSQFEVASVGPSFAGTTSAVACVVRAREKRRPHGTWAHKSLLRASPKQGRPHGTWIGLARAIYIRCMYGIFGRKITKYTVIYGVHIRFWPILHTRAHASWLRASHKKGRPHDACSYFSLRAQPQGRACMPPFGTLARYVFWPPTC